MTKTDAARHKEGTQLYESSRAKREARHAELQASRGNHLTALQATPQALFDSPAEMYLQSLYIDHATPPRPGDNLSSRDASLSSQVQDIFKQDSTDAQNKPALHAYAQEVEQRIASL
jgi:hypothetical protein